MQEEKNKWLHYHEGNLLLSDCTVIAHQANCYNTMGAGIASQIKKMYPEAYDADVNFIKTIVPQEQLSKLSRDEQANLKLGRCSRTFSKDKKRVIVNLYGQLGFDRYVMQTQYDKLKSAFEEMLQGLIHLEKNGFPIKLGIPYLMGCGLAGGDWSVVERDIFELAKKYEREVYIYKFDPTKK